MAKTKDLLKWGENLCWCRPYVSEGGKNALAVNEGKVCGMLLDGEEITDISADVVRQFAQHINESYDLYDGWDDLHIALDGDIRECGCLECPWRDNCEAMDEESVII